MNNDKKVSGVQVVDVRDGASVDAARAIIYADVIKGATACVDTLKEACATNNHKLFIGALLEMCHNAEEMSHVLAKFITARALEEYRAAGGKLPTSREEALALSIKLFPRTLEDGDPVACAKANPATEADKRAEARSNAASN